MDRGPTTLAFGSDEARDGLRALLAKESPRFTQGVSVELNRED